MDLLINPYVFNQKSLSTGMPSSTQHLAASICSYTRIKALWFVFPVFRLWLSLEKLGSHKVCIYSWLKILPAVKHHVIDNLELSCCQYYFYFCDDEQTRFCTVLKIISECGMVFLWLHSISFLNSINIGFKLYQRDTISAVIRQVRTYVLKLLSPH